MKNVTSFFLICSFVISVVGCKNSDTKPSGENNLTVVTIDAYDSASGGLIDPINVWDNYETRRKIVDKVMHNEKVSMIKREGDGILIRTDRGREGWVTYFFIKEFKSK